MTSLANPRSRSPMLGRTGLAAGMLVAFAAALLIMPACGETLHSAVPLDCSGEGSYDVKERYTVGITPYEWYQFGDTTPGAVDTNGADGGIPWTQAIEGGRCGSQAALVLVASGYHDYGDDFVDPDPGSLLSDVKDGGLGCFTAAGAPADCPFDASGYQGIAFWARSPGATTKGVTLLLTDGQSNDFGTIQTDCILAYDAGNNMTMTVTSTTNPGGSTTTSTGVAVPPVPPGTCGNYFAYVLLTTDDWQLYKIPFTAFFQSATTPNRAPDGFDPSTFVSFAVRVDKEAQLQLWIDELGFIRRKAPMADLERILRSHTVLGSTSISRIMGVSQ